MLTRRKLIKTIMVTAGSVSAAGMLSACHDDSDRPGGAIDPSINFPQSVASGDPRPDSVVLWTRVEDLARVSQDLEVGIELSTRSDFSTLLVGEYLTALAVHDHCLKVQVINLEPGTTYYYRFTYGRALSRTGRTRTAPAIDSDVAVNFAFLSCQDYIGRYYNTYLMLLEQEPDFVLFLGDYIYETTNDTQFQSDPGVRSIAFDDQDGALKIGPEGSQFQAAASLDNYRQLYRTYRTDPLLQQVHERFAFINVWDDHEFSDDCWGDTATYGDGTLEETNRQRRRDAEQAFFEFTPISIDPLLTAMSSVGNAGAAMAISLPVNQNQLFPSAEIFRDFRFGRHVHLFMTDYRSFRPDHLIPEDAFPGTVVMDQATLETFHAGRGEDFATLTARYSPYIDIDDAAYAEQKIALLSVVEGLYVSALGERGLATNSAAARAASVVQGNLALAYINPLLPEGLRIAEGVLAGLPRGLAYSTLGKSRVFSDIGARYFVVKYAFDVYAAHVTAQAGTPDILGSAQMQWLESGMRGSDATWKIMGSSVSFAPLILDLALPALPYIEPLYAFVPEDFQTAFYFNVDHWDGFPVQKNALVSGLLGEVGAITLSGDLHATFVTEHEVTGSGLRSFDFTGTAVSSGTWGEFTKTAAASINPGLTALVPLLDQAMQQSTTGRDDVTSKMRFSASAEHGISLVSVDARAVRVDFHLVESREMVGETEVSVVADNYYDRKAEYLARRRIASFEVADGVLTQLS